jgi:hypothetical protein
MDTFGIVDVDLPTGKSDQHLLESDPPLHPCQGGPDAKVQAVSERHVMIDSAAHVEVLRIFELSVIPVGGCGE